MQSRARHALFPCYLLAAPFWGFAGSQSCPILAFPVIVMVLPAVQEHKPKPSIVLDSFFPLGPEIGSAASCRLYLHRVPDSIPFSTQHPATISVQTTVISCLGRPCVPGSRHALGRSSLKCKRDPISPA